MPQSRLPSALLPLFALALTACGGSSAFTTTPALIEAMAPVVPAGEGYVKVEFQVKHDEPLSVVGDNAVDQSIVAILCFDVSAFPSVKSATLRFYLSYEIGDAWSLGMLRLDHIDGGGSLDIADGGSPALSADLFALAQQDEYVLDVSEAVAADIEAGRAVSTFRLRFDIPTDGDGTAEFARFGTSLAADPGLWPTLQIVHPGS